jgi:hypothetical protein
MGKKINVRAAPFENPKRKIRYREADIADAWKRTVDFLVTTLKK